jgi:hypothetical protein
LNTASDDFTGSLIPRLIETSLIQARRGAARFGNSV